jgi:hypothetical protein
MHARNKIKAQQQQITTPLMNGDRDEYCSIDFGICSMGSGILISSKFNQLSLVKYSGISAIICEKIRKKQIFININN